jgi:hypothetical protein
MESANDETEDLVIAQYQTTRIRQLWQNYQRFAHGVLPAHRLIIVLF